MRFRPCIDLHQGKVKQIVGASLRDDAGAAPVTHFVAQESPAWFAERYRRDGLGGGHVIMLGPGNEAAAEAALAAYPGGFHIGGGISAENAAAWLARGAAKVIVTSYAFAGGRIRPERLDALVAAVGRDHLVLDLSCRKTVDGYRVAVDRWQTLTDIAVSAATLQRLAAWASEFLIHGVDVEGCQAGIDGDLVALLAAVCPLPVTYAGGARSLADLDLIDRLGKGRVDATIGSALDIFGGTLAYPDVVEWDRRHRQES